MTYTEWAERQATHYVRWLIRRDMAELLAIDDATHGGPWGEDAFLACLRQRNCIGMVAERHTRIVGFMLYELRPSSIRVLRMGGPLAARVEMTGRLVEKLSDHRRTRIVAAVDDHDDDAIAAYAAAGGVARMRGRDVIELVWRHTPGA